MFDERPPLIDRFRQLARPVAAVKAGRVAD
jgi:hypothetical protein